jgi:hypothetical protein
MLPAEQPELERSRDEIQHAHDVLAFIVTTPKLRKALVKEDAVDRLTAALDVLCWMLRHDHNRTFASNLARLENAMATMGCEMHRCDEMQYPDPAANELGKSDCGESPKEQNNDE